MNESKFTVSSPVDGLPLGCLLVEPDEVKGLVYMMHGLAEYKERYLPLMRCLAEDGFACLISDRRGNGESMKQPEDFDCMYGANAEGILKDMRAVQQELVRRYPTKKLFLYGHSIGAVIALSYMKRWGNEFSGVLLSSMPPYISAVGAGKTYLKLKRRLKGGNFRDPAAQKLMSSNFAIKGESSPFAWLNSDPERVKAYEADPLCGKLGTVDSYIVLIDLMQDAYDKDGWQKVNPLCPFFIAAGADDPCAEGEKGANENERYLKSLHFVKAEHKTYPGMRHELHNEPGSPIVIHDYQNKLTAWL